MSNSVIVPRENEKFFVEPLDGPKTNWANTRITEAINGLLLFKGGEPEIITAKVERIVHFFYEVAYTGDLIERIHKIQENGALPLRLWHKVGNGHFRPYTPREQKPKSTKKRTRLKGIEQLKQEGILRRASELLS